MPIAVPRDVPGSAEHPRVIINALAPHADGDLTTLQIHNCAGPAKPMGCAQRNPGARKSLNCTALVGDSLNTIAKARLTRGIGAKVRVARMECSEMRRKFHSWQLPGSRFAPSGLR
jgi:hypothetical protein